MIFFIYPDQGGWRWCMTTDLGIPILHSEMRFLKKSHCVVSAELMKRRIARSRVELACTGPGPAGHQGAHEG